MNKHMPALERKPAPPPARLSVPGLSATHRCACGGIAAPGGECAACRARRLATRQAGSGLATTGAAPAVVHEVLRQPGQALDGATRRYMEPLFGHDFSQVRVHADARAAESARAVNALAFTVGRSVVFGAGQYAPGTSTGQRLLAHELTHVVQQGSGATSIRNRLAVNNPRDPAERQAERAAQAVAAGRRVEPIAAGTMAPGSTIQRVEGPCEDVVTPHRLLIRGSVHPAVREAQQKLNRFHKAELEAGRPGLSNAPLVDDCIFGQFTFNAVVSFQQRVFPGEPSEHDGMIGDNTWAKLDAVGAPPTTPPAAPPVAPPAPPAPPPAPAAPAAGRACFDGSTVTIDKGGQRESCAAVTDTNAPTPEGRFCVRQQGEAQHTGWWRGLTGQDHGHWYLIEPQFSTKRSRMHLHPGTRSAGCVTVTDTGCFDRMVKVLNLPGTDRGTGYDGYPPGNDEGITHEARAVDCVAWLEVNYVEGCN